MYNNIIKENRSTVSKGKKWGKLNSHFKTALLTKLKNSKVC